MRLLGGGGDSRGDVILVEGMVVMNIVRVTVMMVVAVAIKEVKIGLVDEEIIVWVVEEEDVEAENGGKWRRKGSGYEDLFMELNRKSEACRRRD